MEKIKLNLVSGTNLEKPLVTAFKSNGAMYVGLDNEINGTMGLSIILVSKLENNELTKINDQNEWGAVKETLRMIIAGNQVDYVVVEPTLAADDMFFSQLTLPVASFDALKNNYHPNVENVNAVSGVDSLNTNMMDVNSSVAPQNPVESMISPMQTAVTLDNAGSSVNSSTQVETISNMQTQTGAVETSAGVSPVMPSSPASAQTIAPVSESQPTVNYTSDVEPIPEVPEEPKVPTDFTADKEAFLKACENMFDALVAKFNNK